MFGWIPIIGPIIDGLVSIFSKWQDTKLGMYRVDGTVDVEGMKASANIIAATKDDIGVRLARDIVMFPICIWTAIISWDNIIKHVSWHHLNHYFLVVEKYPPSVEYLPYAVLMFLFGNIGINAWRRR